MTDLRWNDDGFGPQCDGWFVYRDRAGKCYLCLSEHDGGMLTWRTEIPPGGWDGEWLGPLPEGTQ